MDTVKSAFGAMFGSEEENTKPVTSPIQVQRVDAYPQLIVYHNPACGPKPTPSTLKSSTVLPIRTKISQRFVNDRECNYEVLMAQSHAYYEEIDTIPAVAMGKDTIFPWTEHAYVIHPIRFDQAWDYTPRVLENIKQWIEESEQVYANGHHQVQDFHKRRMESLDIVKRELFRRRMHEVGEEEGWLGVWDEVEPIDDEAEGQNGPNDNSYPIVNDQTAETLAKIDAAGEEGLKQKEPQEASSRRFSEVDETVQRMVRNLRELEYEAAIGDGN
ncbi:hypothetical protein BU24DRAFT_470179 [Aaosphaeria arxii CBS 175.79]|uniref:Uncharacterized protein n=1 Tax=Aaosphaeria arxii CBS 175.79 TaxID=1450172 RepID=A0A6A5Y7B0_9PLEO|nr:uncharacterized protein BU24DRAFT_470179 [Aaosphaeria arxii CBS 175.79]KAF2021418.1 hypothetical protein BU24DRAFT_470179 [Aaosphaeria arxii CBS 175.79]